jgi:hypothetical protein
MGLTMPGDSTEITVCDAHWARGLGNSQAYTWGVNCSSTTKMQLSLKPPLEEDVAQGTMRTTRLCWSSSCFVAGRLLLLTTVLLLRLL